MGIKINKFAVLLVASFLVQISCNYVFASNDYNIVRVGLTDNKFQNVLKQEVIVYGTSDIDICDKETRKIIARIPANDELTIKNGIVGLEVFHNGQSATLRNFVIVCQQGLLGVKDLKRKGKQAEYHGAFEVIQSKDRKSFYVGN